jgi:hypothetical protein
MQQKPGEDFYNVEKVVKLLGRTPECIRQMLRFEALEGEHKGDDPHAPLRFTSSPSTYAGNGADARATRMASSSLYGGFAGTCILEKNLAP